MATEQEKEELMETLKFTPRKYRVDIWGYGGEIYWGAVDRKIYDFFKDKKINIDQYAGSWNDTIWEDIPSDMRPFDPGAPYDISGVHESGCTFDGSSTIVVSDELGNEVWRSSLDYSDLESNGVGIECTSENYLSEYDVGTVVFYGAQGEKGTFFGGEFELRAPFNPELLKINFQDLEGWELVWGVEYNGEEIESYDYDTSGKWGENKWIIVGGEEVYEGVDRDEESYEDTSDDNEEITLDEEWDPAAELDKIQVPEELVATEIECNSCGQTSNIADVKIVNGVAHCPHCGSEFAPPEGDDDHDHDHDEISWNDESISPDVVGTYEVIVNKPWPDGGIADATWTGAAWEQDGEVITIHQWRGKA